MRYRSITLNNCEKDQFVLIKYSEEYKEYLEELRRMNEYLASSVEKCPTIYSELCDHQSYMIFSGETNCIGAIYIATSTDEKNLEIEVHFIEEKFENKEGIIDVLEQIISTLGFYCFDKENIEIHLLNNIDLEKINKYKYKKNCISENITTYTTTNKFNNKLYPKLLNEMSETEKNLINWKQSWMPRFDFCVFNDCNNLFDKELMQKYKDGTIPLSEIFYKAESVLWDDINSIKSKRSIIFERNGQIYFTKSSKDFGKNNYEFSYNILRDEFNFKKVDWRKNAYLEIDENNVWTRIKSDNLKVVYLKADKIKKVQYKSPMVNNSSISLNLYIKQDEIERCYVDFRTHRNDRKNKINGIYALRILSKDNICTLNFISRKGLRCNDFADELKEEDEQLFTTILNGNMTIELLDELVKKMITIVNRKAFSKGEPIILSDNEAIVSNACEMETEAINYVKQIKGEIPLPHLQENLEKFIEEYDIKKNNAKKMVLKK